MRMPQAVQPGSHDHVIVCAGADVGATAAQDVASLNEVRAGTVHLLSSWPSHDAENLLAADACGRQHRPGRLPSGAAAAGKGLGRASQGQRAAQPWSVHTQAGLERCDVANADCCKSMICHVLCWQFCHSRQSAALLSATAA